MAVRDAKAKDAIAFIFSNNFLEVILSTGLMNE
jgi:hypothetical protein